MNPFTLLCDMACKYLGCVITIELDVEDPSSFDDVDQKFPVKP